MEATTKTSREQASAITRLFWDNFIKSEPAAIMENVIEIEIEKARLAEREACAALVHDRLGADGYGVAQMIRARK